MRFPRGLAASGAVWRAVQGRGTRTFHARSLQLAAAPTAAPVTPASSIIPNAASAAAAFGVAPMLPYPLPAMRVAILGAGLSGLTLAHQLQRHWREQGRANCEIHMYEQTGRSGGWVRSAASHGFLMERGPRSLMYRREDEAAEAGLQLVMQLNLGERVILADPAALKRFVWNGGEHGRMVQLPSGLKSLWNFPHRNILLKGIWRDLRQPKLEADSEEASDESVSQFIARRMGQPLVDEMMDPMIAGIYAGDPAKLSMQSCFPRLATRERQSGGIIRAAKKPDVVSDVEHAREVQREVQLQQHAWKRGIVNSKGGIYSLQGGLGTLIRALRLRLNDDTHDAYASILSHRRGDVPEAAFHMHASSPVRGLHINEANKPVLHVGATEGTQAQQAEYDHVFSTLSTHDLHGLLSAPDSSLPLSSTHQSELVSLLSPSSMPFASVWVVHVVYAGDVLRPEQRGFGLLVPSKHVIAGQEILGISYDSCIFPQHDSGRPGGETRITVMIGGARHPWLIDASEADVSAHALKAVSRMVGIDHQTHVPLLVEAHLNRNCIPQFAVGHARKQHSVHQIMQHLAYTPESFELPVVKPLPTMEVPMYESAARAAASAVGQPGAGLRPLTLLGTNYGVSLNDCMHHASRVASDFVRRSAEKRS